MAAVIQLLQLVTEAGFIILGLVALRIWLQSRDESRGWLLVTLGSLGLAVAASLLQQATNFALGELGEDIAVFTFLVSGYAMLRFRGTFIPLERWVHGLALTGLVVLTVVAAAAMLPYRPGARPNELQFAITIGLVAYWALAVGDPVVRFWLGAAGLPAVQKLRLRSLSGGYAAIVVLLVFAVIGAEVSQHPLIRLATSLVALLAVPVIYIAFEPPAWLRRNWREPEEEAIRAGVRNLVLFSPTRAEMADRGLEWAMRIVGADCGFIVDADGALLAAEGISPEQAAAVAEEFSGAEGGVRLGDGRAAIAEPLDLSAGEGVLMVVAGPFTPLFGSDEVTRFRAYATFLVAALDRAVLTERLAALERTKTEFLNLASHELRGPLTVLRGYLAMIEAGTLGPIPDQLREVLPILHAKSNEMNGLVEEMIEAARLEEGRLELHREQVDLRDLARRALDMVRPITDPTHPVVVKQPRHPIRVEVDPDRVVTIVNNLLSNAIKYSPKGGEVRLEVEEDDDHAEVRVKDRGVGIDPAKMNVLFTRFGRIATPETKHISGTGLGLYLSRELARLHGGDLVAESEPGKGSTFVLRVPMTSV